MPPALEECLGTKILQVFINPKKVFQCRVVGKEEQAHNLKRHGVRFPAAVTEAKATILVEREGAIATTNIIMKVDSGSSVTLSHPSYLVRIKTCKECCLLPVMLDGIGGSSDTIHNKVGILSIQ